MAGSDQFFVADTGQLTVRRAHTVDLWRNFEDIQSKTYNFIIWEAKISTV